MKSSQYEPEVILRAMEPEDLDFLYAIENDKDLWDVGVTNVPYSRYNLYNYLAECKNDIYADRQVRFMITDVHGVCVGIVDLVNFEPKHLRAELGIAVQREFRGQGFAQSAIKEMLKYAHEIIHLSQVYVVVSEANSLSIKLFKELGFVESGHLKAWLHEEDSWRDAKLLQFFFVKKSL